MQAENTFSQRLAAGTAASVQKTFAHTPLGCTQVLLAARRAASQHTPSFVLSWVCGSQSPMHSFTILGADSSHVTTAFGVCLHVCLRACVHVFLLRCVLPSSHTHMYTHAHRHTHTRSHTRTCPRANKQTNNLTNKQRKRAGKRKARPRRALANLHQPTPLLRGPQRRAAVLPPDCAGSPQCRLCGAFCLMPGCVVLL